VPQQVRKSLTWDRGMELADHKTITVTTGLEVYFADPRNPWQRGTNENTNRLLRQYLPKGQSMAHLTQDDLDAIAAKLNSRPRKTLGFDTPAIGSQRCCADRLSSPRLFSRSPSRAPARRPCAATGPARPAHPD
jgi:IS30 family transposase